MRILSIVLVVAACAPPNTTFTSEDASADAPGSDGGDPSTPVSGSRLKVRWVAYADGARTFRGFHDAQLDVDCGINAWDDGHTYCTPSWMSLGYADAACTQPAGLTSYSSPPPFVAQIGTVIDGLHYTLAHVYHTGAALPPGTAYQRSATGTCTAITGSYPLYSIGAELAGGELVELTKTSAPSNGPLALESYTSADGARDPVGLRDLANDLDCVPQSATGFTIAGATSARCRPTAAPAQYFTDAQCTQAIAIVKATVPAPTFVYVGDRAGCPYADPTYYTAGAGFTPPTMVYVLDASTCYPLATPAGIAYPAKTELSLVTMTRSHDSTPGHRLQASHYAAPPTSYRDYLLFDTMLGADCYATAEFADGVTRCLPYGGSDYDVSLFSDAACQAPLAGLYTNPSCAPLPPSAYTSVYRSAQLGYDTYTIGAGYNGPVYMLSSTCQATTPPVDRALYRLGAKIPPASFATASFVTDP